MNKVLTLTEEDFNTAVKAEVERQLSSKEEAEARRLAGEALEEAKRVFTELKGELAAKDAKLAEYEKALADLEVAIPSEAEVSANARVVELEQQLEQVVRRAEIAEAALETLAREETAAMRMAELDEAGVSLEGEAAETQYVKVRGMSDEEFGAYKQELIALKARYSVPSAEEDEVTELGSLSEDEINMIAQSLGCDPADEKCISLVREVAEKTSEISQMRKKKKNKKGDEKMPFMPWMKKGEGSQEEEVVEDQNKESASTKLSLGEAISRSINQTIQVDRTLREELEAAWRYNPKEEK